MMVNYPNNDNAGLTYDAIINAGTVSIDQDIVIERLTLSGGLVGGENSLSLNNGSSTWSGGTLSGSGLLTINSGATLTMQNSGPTLSRSVVNNGSVNWSSGNVDLTGVTFTNNNTFTASGPVASAFQFFNGASGTNVFNNVGTFIKQGAGTADFRGPTFPTAVLFNNSGTVDVQAGTLRLLAGGTHTGSFSGATGATLQFGGIHSFAAGSNITGGMRVAYFGNTQWNGSTTNFSGPVENYGTFNVAAHATLGTTGGFTNLTGALLNGTGTIAANLTNSGTLAPGNSPGIIHVNGDYTQTSSGTLEIEVGGLAPGTEHDQVIVSGTAAIDGNLTFPLVNNPTTGTIFHPHSGDEITFLTANSVTGTPKAIFAPNLGAVAPNLSFVVIKNNQDMRLRFVQPTDTHFVDNSSSVGDWNQASNWSSNRVPDPRDKIELSRSIPIDPTIQVANGNASAYQVYIHDQSSPITVNVANAMTLAAAVGDVTIGQNATVSLGTAGNTMDSGTLAASSSQSVILENGGTLKGNGTVEAQDLTVTNGTVAPGFSVGHLNVAGNYHQGPQGTLVIDVEGSVAVHNDTISVTGDAALGGKLRINAANLQLIQPGQVYPILSAASRTGTFSSVETVGNNDVFFVPVYSTPGAGASVGGGASLGSGAEQYPGCPTTGCVAVFDKGDMNRNGRYDPGDITAFALALVNRQVYGVTYGIHDPAAAGSLNDWTPDKQNYRPDGLFDVDDIPGFRNMMVYYGVTSGTGFGAAFQQALAAAIPEPASAASILVAGCMLFACRVSGMRRGLRSAR